MKCHNCDNESTGILVQLCDECFDVWEASVDQEPATADLGAINPALIYKHAGGDAPDDTTAARVGLQPDCVSVQYLKTCNN